MNSGSDRLLGQAYAPGFEPGFWDEFAAYWAGFFERVMEADVLALAPILLALIVLAGIFAPSPSERKAKKKKRHIETEAENMARAIEERAAQRAAELQALRIARQQQAAMSSGQTVFAPAQGLVASAASELEAEDAQAEGMGAATDEVEAPVMAVEAYEAERVPEPEPEPVLDLSQISVAPISAEGAPLPIDPEPTPVDLSQPLPAVASAAVRAAPEPSVDLSQPLPRPTYAAHDRTAAGSAAPVDLSQPLPRITLGVPGAAMGEAVAPPPLAETDPQADDAPAALASGSVPVPPVDLSQPLPAPGQVPSEASVAGAARPVRPHQTAGPDMPEPDLFLDLPELPQRYAGYEGAPAAPGAPPIWAVDDLPPFQAPAPSNVAAASQIPSHVASWMQIAPGPRAETSPAREPSGAIPSFRSHYRAR
ncbi:MAG: hypothetical protein AAGJ91_02765 [Pseudomonadota bacterium]